MSYFFCRLNPPRLTFATDMSGEERQLMQQHSAYWRVLLGKGKVVVFGPVADPAGPWGVVVVEAADTAEVQKFLADDPVILANQSFSYDAFPMLSAVVRV
jgi:uncharacterized protein YciI